MALRELLIAQQVLDERSATKLDGEPLTEPGSALLLAMALDNSLPPRLQFSEWDWLRHYDRYERMQKRKLLKLLYEQWRAVGCPRPRGYISPDRSETAAQLSFVYALWNEALVGNIDPSKEGRAESERKVIGLLREHGLGA